jgi:purine-nucleoside phosphorylase
VNTVDFARFEAAVAASRPDAAVVLGSGMAEILTAFRPAAAVAFGDVPGLAAPSVAGHGGTLAVGDYAGRAVLVFQGRLHFYEGHSWGRVAEPVRLAERLGAKVLLLTNAAGGIRDDLRPGSLMALSDHMRWNRPGGHRGPGPGDRPSVYSERLRGLLRAEGIAEGVYAALTGPSYETRAEIRALKAAGADAVGMSTAHEAEEAAALGLEVVAVSGITNRACGLGDGPLHHEEVLVVAREMAGRMAGVIDRVLRAG